MFERRSKPLLPRGEFYARLARSAGIGLLLIAFALGLGMAGYRVFESMSWVDAFVNAAMILSGMGPVSSLQTTGGKIFAGCYALFSGLFFIAVMGLILAPITHMVMQTFHVDEVEVPKDPH